jgi:hypothetical protein
MLALYLSVSANFCTDAVGGALVPDHLLRAITREIQLVAWVTSSAAA